MTVPSLNDYQRLNETREIIVKHQDLPLHCPMDETALWCAHPRIFLAIENSSDKTVRCPYCGTLYRLLN
ncbi:MAG: zinc-finger domain-containing protein [Thiothrix sp.]